jgi:hypothetical protein
MHFPKFTKGAWKTRWRPNGASIHPQNPLTCLRLGKHCNLNALQYDSAATNQNSVAGTPISPPCWELSRTEVTFAVSKKQQGAA